MQIMAGTESINIECRRTYIKTSQGTSQMYTTLMYQLQMF